MVDFKLQITNFEKYGIFNYAFDEAGNVVLNPSSSGFQQNYLALPLLDVNYNNTKLLNFYDPTFTEFVVNTTTNTNSSNVPTDVLDQLNSVTAQNQDLQNRLNDLISQNEQNTNVADSQAVKDIVIGLRIQLRQGSSSADFDSVFPYLPIPLEQKDNAP